MTAAVERNVDIPRSSVARVRARYPEPRRLVSASDGGSARRPGHSAGPSAAQSRVRLYGLGPPFAVTVIGVDIDEPAHPTSLPASSMVAPYVPACQPVVPTVSFARPSAPVVASPSPVVAIAPVSGSR